MWDFQEMLKSGDRIFKLCSEKPKIVNDLFNNPALAALWIGNILRTEYVVTAIETGLKNKKEPDWKTIQTALVNKSDSETAEDILIDSKRIWNVGVKDWNQACKYEMIKFQRKKMDTLKSDQLSMEFNTIAWTLFTYSFDKKQLEQGLTWVNKAITLHEKPVAIFMDTKANLLYKLERKTEALLYKKRL
jgi:hypothetical protein